MQHTHSHNRADDALRAARAAILSGKSIPASTQAILEACGHNVGALEQRIIEMNRFA